MLPEGEGDDNNDRWMSGSTGASVWDSDNDDVGDADDDDDVLAALDVADEAGGDGDGDGVPLDDNDWFGVDAWRFDSIKRDNEIGVDVRDDLGDEIQDEGRTAGDKVPKGIRDEVWLEAKLNRSLKREQRTDSWLGIMWDNKHRENSEMRERDFVMRKSSWATCLLRGGE